MRSREPHTITGSKYGLAPVLWIVALVLLIVAGVFAFKGSSASEPMQVGPNVPTVIRPTTPGNTPLYTPGRLAPVSFDCTSVWETWIEKAPAEASDGTSYSSLTETRSPADYSQRWYGKVDAVLSLANSACKRSERGHLHLFWTLLTPAALLLIVAEVVRRSA